ncbi:MAG: cytochrome c3 family protein [Nannocystaceae bacterium]|nr:cytochrome c3 family protein [Myxococcales bacterium]
MILAGALVALVFACGLALSIVRAGDGEVPATMPTLEGPGARHNAVYPEQELPLKFDHSRHLTLGMQCTDCHKSVAQSVRAPENNLPTGAACDGCHGARHPRTAGEPEDCNICHTAVEGGRVTATVKTGAAKLHFSHKAHLARGTDCATCHGDMSKVRLATSLQLPDEGTCLRCHDGLRARDRCSVCHPSDRGGVLLTRDVIDRTAPRLIPRGSSAWGAAHDLHFVEDHKGIAKANPGLCANCHDEKFCTDCHGGAIRPLRIHAANYLTTHAIDARGATQDCQSCHRLQTDCLACHERLGMGSGPDSRFGLGSGLRFHPDGWAGPPGAPQAHAFPAQRNIGACASCHTEDTCLACHATTRVARPGLAVSPHGLGFAGSARCQALALRNRRVCLKCHAPTDRTLECM